MKHVISLCILLSILAFFSCGKVADNTPGTVTVEGQPISLPYGLAVKENPSSMGKGGYLIYLFNHNQTSCEQVRATSRTVPQGEISARVYADRGGSWSVVGIEYHSQLGVKVQIVKEPASIGDEVVLFVPSKISFVPMVGKYKNKNVTIFGRFTGKYCGERQR